MADDNLRMKAGVDYDPSGVNRMKAHIAGIRGTSAPVVAQDFEKIRGSVAKVSGEIRSTLLPAFSAMGLGGLAVGGSIAGVIGAVKSLTAGLTEMRMLGKETGTTVNAIRQMQALGKRFDIAPEAMSTGIMSFSDRMREIKNKWGETYEWMRTASPEMAELAKKLFASKDMDEAAEIAMRGIASIQSPKLRQMLAEKLFGSRQFSQLGSEGLKEYDRQRDDVRKTTPALPPDADKIARDFKMAMDRMGDAAINLQTEFAKALLPVLPEMQKGIEDFTTFLRDHKKTVSAFFKEVIGDARTFLKEIRDTFVQLKEAYDGTKRFFGGDNTGGAVKNGLMPEASIGEALADPEIAARRNRMAQINREIALADERIARKESEPDPLGEGRATDAEGRARRQRLIEEQDRLSTEIQSLRQRPKAEKMSFDRSEPANLAGLVQRASLVPLIRAAVSDEQDDRQGRGDAGEGRRLRDRLVQETKRLADEIAAFRRDILSRMGLGAGAGASGGGSFGGAGVYSAAYGGGGGYGGGGRGFSSGAIDSARTVPGLSRDRVDEAGRAARGALAPSVEANPGAYKEALDHIAKAEGTHGRGDYNASLGYGKYLPGRQEQNLTGMTLNQISDLGRHMRRQPGNPNSSALGRYQIVGDTMRRLMKRMGLKGDELFDEKMQDRMGAELFRDTKGDPGRLAREWASLRGRKLNDAVDIAGRIGSAPPSISARRDASDNRSFPSIKTMKDWSDASGAAPYPFPGGWNNGSSRAAVGRSAPDISAPPHWFGKAMGALGGGTSRVEGNASVDINLNGLPRGARTSTSMGGMFKEISVNRGRSMGAAEDI